MYELYWSILSYISTQVHQHQYICRKVILVHIYQFGQFFGPHKHHDPNITITDISRNLLRYGWSVGINGKEKSFDCVIFLALNLNVYSELIQWDLVIVLFFFSLPFFFCQPANVTAIQTSAASAWRCFSSRADAAEVCVRSVAITPPDATASTARTDTLATTASHWTTARPANVSL